MTASERTQDTDPEATADFNQDSAADDLKHVFQHSKRLVGEITDLLGIEARLAGRSLALMLALAIVLALLLVSVWLLLCAAGAMWLIHAELLNAPLALLAVGGVNAVMALLVWWALSRLSGNLSFRGFRQVLREINSDHPSGGSS